MRALDRWRGLDPRERRMAVRCALAVGVAIALLRLAGTQRARRWATPPVSGADPPADFIRQTVASVERAGRYLPGAACLATSLALTRLLRQGGCSATLQLGVATAPRFEAHAWVVCEGMEVTDSKGARALRGSPQPEGEV